MDGNITWLNKQKYSSPSLIRPSDLSRNCDHIREGGFGERENYIDSSSRKDLWPY